MLVRDETTDAPLVDHVVSEPIYRPDWGRLPTRHHLRYRVLRPAQDGWEPHTDYCDFMPGLDRLLDRVPTPLAPSTAVCHLLLTRFNLRSRAAGYHRGIGDAWLRERFDLFERYCAPSVANQSCERFRWLIFVDEETDAADLARLRQIAPAACCVPCAPDIARGSHLRELTDLQRWIAADAEVLITTRLDNDDALHREAVAHIQRHADGFYATGQPRFLHNFLFGAKLDATTSAVYLNRSPSSPFLSLVERCDRDPPQGVMQGSHAVLGDHMETMQDRALLGWLQVVHETNALNGLRPQRDHPVHGLDVREMFAVG